MKVKNILKSRNHLINRYLKIYLLKSLMRNPNLSEEERQLYYLKHQSCFSKKINFSQKISYCAYSAEAHSVYKVTRLSRNFFKNMVLYGKLPGCILVHGNGK